MLPHDFLPAHAIPPDLQKVVNLQQMFRLVETLLPFEACLYHQVLPLSFQGERLNLGMVDSSDKAALAYIKQLLGAINCVVIAVPVALQFHQEVLSAYLKYINHKTQAASPPKPLEGQSAGKSVDPAADRSGILGADQDTFILQEDPNINDHPDAPPLFPVSSGIKPTPSNPESPTVLAPPPIPPTPPNFHKIQELKITANHLTSPVQVIQGLPPRLLLQELLGRVLVGGIGRLYLERQEQGGRILWSQSGVLQSVLEHLPVSVFEGVVAELKLLAELPSVPIHGSQQVELERSYQKNRILLRIRFMGNRYGEEATLQVLRGAALKFYEKKQLDRLGKDALSIAQQLQRKLEQIRLEEGPIVKESEDSNTTLSELSQILVNLNETLKRLE